MALEILTGAPGAGKSYGAVSTHLDHAMKYKRLVVTNLPIQLSEVREQYGDEYVHLIVKHKFSIDTFTFSTSLHIMKVYNLLKQYFSLDEKARLHHYDYTPLIEELPNFHDLDHKQLYEDYTQKINDLPSWMTWQGENGEGPLLIIDEAGDIWGKDHFASLKDKDKEEDIIKFFRYHRHGGFDFLLLAQALTYIHVPIRKCAERAFHFMNMKQSTGFNRSSMVVTSLQEGAVVKGSDIRKSVPFKEKFFKLYQSRTVSQVKTTDVSRGSSRNILLMGPMVFLVYPTVIFFCWALYYLFTNGLPSIDNTLSSTPILQQSQQQELIPFENSLNQSQQVQQETQPSLILLGFSGNSLFVSYDNSPAFSIDANFSPASGICGVYIENQLYRCNTNLPPADQFLGGNEEEGG